MRVHYEPQIGDAVIMEHPFMHDRVVVALIEKVTPQMVGVQYLDRYGTIVISDTRMRKRSGIIGKLRDDLTMKEAQKLAVEYHERLIADEKAAREAFVSRRNPLLQGGC